MVSKSFQFIFKPVLSCNLACKYCYAKLMRHDKHSRMDFEEAKAAFDWIFKFCEYFDIQRTSILWQGGEPLMAGASFMRQIINYYEDGFKSRGITNTNTIQTNLLLMDEDFISNIHEYFNHKVGFSYDYKSATRCFPDGKDVSNAVWRMVRKLSREGLDLRCICQITKENVLDMDGLYRHFKDQGVSFKISQIFPTQNNECGQSEVVSTKLSSAAICRLFDIWFDDSNPSIDITNLKELSASFIRGFSTECCRKMECSSLLLSIAPAGRIFPCARFDSPSDVVGNYYVDSPVEVMRNRQIKYNNIFPRADGCDDCRYKELCHGGCLYNRLVGWGGAECLSNKIILSHIEKRLMSCGVI